MNRTENEIMSDFFELACALSPENLYCDGEISEKQAMKKYKSLQKAWVKLEDEIGYQLTEEKVWSWYNKNKNYTQNKKIF